MAITALPNPPSRSDPANFPERADAFMAALPVFAQEANLLQGQVNEAAEAADENAAAAGRSAEDAANSRSLAGQKAADAVAAADAAGQERAAAASAAALAAQWATKTGAPVGGGEYSAKHYAQLAAMGMGLPVFALSNIPNLDVGPIFVPTQGAMEWRSGRYVVQRADHGQCRFVYVSPTECRLMPCNGDGLIINGRQYRIDAAGVPVSNAGLAASTNYYAYAKEDGSGGFGLEFQTFAAAPHSRHTDGVEIKTGDPTRTLVGMVITTSTSQFIVNQTNYRIASWFNRRQVRLLEAVSTGTSSSTFVGLNGGFACCGWGNETLLDLAVSGSTAGSSTYSVLNPVLNGDPVTSPRSTGLPASADVMICYVWKATPTADGLYVFSQQGRSTAGTLVNWVFNQIGEVWL